VNRMLPRGSCFRLSFRPSFKQWLIREKYLQSPIDNFPGRLPLLICARMLTARRMETACGSSMASRAAAAAAFGTWFTMR